MTRMSSSEGKKAMLDISACFSIWSIFCGLFCQLPLHEGLETQGEFFFLIDKRCF